MKSHSKHFEEMSNTVTKLEHWLALTLSEVMEIKEREKSMINLLDEVMTRVPNTKQNEKIIKTCNEIKTKFDNDGFNNERIFNIRKQLMMSDDLSHSNNSKIKELCDFKDEMTPHLDMIKVAIKNVKHEMTTDEKMR